MLSKEHLHRILSYDGETGEFRWRENRQSVRAGDIAGSFTSKGYRRIKIEGRQFFAHRLAWLYVYGTFPSPDLEVDHKDGCKTNNRIKNLRLASRSENQNNIPARRGSKVPLKGVSVHKCGMYQAAIKLDGRNCHLGLFRTAEEAHRAYVNAAKVHHGEFLCVESV